MNNISRTAIFTLLLISMTTMMSNVAIVTTLPRLKDYFSDIENIEFYSRLMLTLPSLVIAFLSPFIGHFVYKFGKKNSAILALIIFSLTGTAGLYLDDIKSFLISRAMFGIAVATLMIVVTSLVGDYFKQEQRHKFMGYQSAFMAIGGVGFVIGGGVLSDIDWRLPFGIYFIGVVLLPMVIFFLAEKSKEDMSLIEEQTVQKKLIGIYGLAFFYMLIFFILPTQIPFLIIDTFGASGKMASSIIALAFLSNAIGAISFSKLKQKYSFSTIYIIALFIIGIGFLAIGNVHDVHLFYLTSPIMGFGGGIMMTNVTAWMLSRTSFEKRVKSSGYLTSFLFMGQFFSPIVFHPFVAYFGVQHFFIFIGCCLVTIVVVITSFLRYKTKLT